MIAKCNAIRIAVAVSCKSTELWRDARKALEEWDDGESSFLLGGRPGACGHSRAEANIQLLGSCDVVLYLCEQETGQMSASALLGAALALGKPVLALVPEWMKKKRPYILGHENVTCCYSMEDVPLLLARFWKFGTMKSSASLKEEV